MTKKLHPRRSALYMPGNNARALEKARELPADCVILDLEDAVAPETKAAARSQVTAAVRAGGFGRREVIVRINGDGTPWFAEDIAAVASCGANAVLVPKVESAAAVKETLRQLANAGAPADLALWIMAETPRGIQALNEVLEQRPEIAVVVMGTSDLAKELRIDPGPERTGLVHALSQSVLAARAHGIDIIDGVHLALDDEEGYRAACLQGRELGFDGKTLIHPRQIDIANEVFGVSAAAAGEARAIVEAWQQARADGQGVTVVNGRLIEQLHVDEAKRLLALHAAINE